MDALIGLQDCKIDEKGRVTLPSRFKTSLPDESTSSLFLSYGLDPCLTLYTRETWESIYQHLRTLNPFSQDARIFMRTMINGVQEVEIDKAGRLLIPKRFLDFANINKSDQVLLGGMGDTIEIWSPETYDKYILTNTDDIAEAAEAYLNPRRTVDDTRSGTIVSLEQTKKMDHEQLPFKNARQDL